VQAAPEKIKKDAPTMTLELVKAPDILASVAALEPRPFVVGFAAETQRVEEHARSKLERKRLDMIAANRVGDGMAFDRDDNALTVLWNGGREQLETAGKLELARRLIGLIAERMGAAAQPASNVVHVRR
jgi:phosphopantothenoylcysteine decarboxylase / phosphopantothenate---cysteine ligase